METTIMKNSVLVIGANGMVGRTLVKQLEETNDYSEVKAVDIELDMTKKSSAKLIKYYDYIYHVAGKKGSPTMATENPAAYLPMLQFDSNIIEAVGKYKPKWFLYTSSVGVYPPSELFKEDEVWNKVPSENDMIPAYIKRMGELSCRAISKSYNYNNISIVRPANIFGPGDNYGDGSMVVPSLISKGYHNDTINVWGDGSEVRDFIYSKDVARGMIHMVTNKINDTINLGSGEGYSISELANIISKYSDKEVKYDVSKSGGDKKRVMDMTKAFSYGFELKYSIEQALLETIEDYRDVQSN